MSDFKPFQQAEECEKFDYVGRKREKLNCEGNAELNDYINKP